MIIIITHYYGERIINKKCIQIKEMERRIQDVRCEAECI